MEQYSATDYLNEQGEIVVPEDGSEYLSAILAITFGTAIISMCTMCLTFIIFK